jgi:hypothetical protein
MLRGKVTTHEEWFGPKRLLRIFVACKETRLYPSLYKTCRQPLELIPKQQRKQLVLRRVAHNKKAVAKSMGYQVEDVANVEKSY